MSDKFTQRQRILDLLSYYQDLEGSRWVPLPKLLDLRIANYRARISEMREAGVKIENLTEWIDGTRRSWYRLVLDV